ncbi:CinA family protein, partial [Neisseria iguanae]
FGQTLHALFGLFETVIGTALRCQQLPSYRLQDTADGHSAGTVWFGLATPVEHIECSALFEGGRENVRRQAVGFALNLLAGHLTPDIPD